MRYVYIFMVVAVGLNINAFSQVFPGVKIGAQIWMSQNLNVDKFRNGDPIPQARNLEEYQKANENGTPIWCYYNFDANNEKVYGKLYNFYAVNDKRGLAPNGWKVPSLKDWKTLISFLGGEKAAVNKLKSKTGWTLNGNNASGFDALPGGIGKDNNSFEGLGSDGYWWSSTPTGDVDAAYTLTIYGNTNLSTSPLVMWLCLSVRCVK